MLMEFLSFVLRSKKDVVTELDDIIQTNQKDIQEYEVGGMHFEHSFTIYIEKQVPLRKEAHRARKLTKRVGGSNEDFKLSWAVIKRTKGVSSRLYA